MAFAAFKTLALTLIFWSVLGLVFLLWTMPFLLGFAAVYRSGRGDLWAMRLFRRLIVLVPIGILVIGGAVYLRTVPSYDGPWEQEVTVTQKLDAENMTAVEFSSFGYLKGIKATVYGREITLDEHVPFKRIEMPLEMNWMREELLSTPLEEKVAEILVHLKLRLDFERAPFTVNLRLKSDRPFSVDRANVKYQHKKNRATIRWAHCPGQSLVPELDVWLPNGANLDAEIAATFLEVPVLASCKGKYIHFINRAEIKRKVKLLGRI